MRVRCGNKNNTKINPTDNATLPRCERSEIQTLPEDALPAFLGAIAGHEFEAVFFTTVFTGLRKGEVLGLTWGCVDFERGTVLINKQLRLDRGTRSGYNLYPPKTTSRAGSPRADGHAAALAGADAPTGTREEGRGALTQPGGVGFHK